MSASTSGFQSYAASDQGIRGNNEDEVYADDDSGIYFVVDGMGGHAAGEQAARIAKERLLGRLNRLTGTPQQRIREAITLANNAIFETAAQHPDWNGMACVLTVALLSSENAIIGHVGDSRLYKISGKAPELKKITKDHSPVGELEDSKQLTEGEAMNHPRRNEVFRDVGSAVHDPDDQDFIDIYETPVEPDSGLLLCSDGLTDALPIVAIRKVLRENSKDGSAAVQTLIRQAIDNGGKDNVSVVLVQGSAVSSPEPKSVATAAKEAVVQQPLARPTFISEEPQPLWQRIAWSLLWVAIGAGLVIAAQQAMRFLPQGPPVATPKTPQDPRTPTTLIVNARLPGAQPSLAAALAVAAEGDTIELTPGVYDEPVKVTRSNILIDGSGALLRPKPTDDGVDGITITGAAGVRIQNLRIAGDTDGDLLVGIHIVDSQVSLRNVHVLGAAGPGIDATGASTLNMDGSSVRDCSGPGMLLRTAVAATVKYTAIVGNGRDAGDRQPGIFRESAIPAILLGNTIANNGGPAIVQPDMPLQETLAKNLFSLEGRKGKLDDIRVTPKRVKK